MAAPLALLAFLGSWEILGLVVIVILIFGVRKLPELGKGLGQGIRNFRGEMQQMQDDTSPKDKSSDSTPIEPK